MRLVLSLFMFAATIGQASAPVEICRADDPSRGKRIAGRALTLDASKILKSFLAQFRVAGVVLLARCFEFLSVSVLEISRARQPP